MEDTFHMVLHWLSKHLISVRKSLGALAPAVEAYPRQDVVAIL